MRGFEKLSAAAYGGAAALAALDAARLLPLSRLPGLCLFHAVTGLPCPGCGMTRALVAAFQGRFSDSLSLHPLGLPLLAVWTAFLAWGALNRARGREFSRGFPDLLAGKRAWAALALVLAVYAVRLPQALAAGDPRFDASSKSAAPLAVDRDAPVPPAAGKPALPDDLKDAAARFGAEAQRRRLAADPPAKRPFTFAVIGDAEPGRFPWERVYAPGPDGFWRLLSQAQAVSPAFVLQLGDLVSKGTLANYRALYKRMAGVSSPPFFNVIGNHDRSRPNGDAAKTLYEGVNGSPDYYFDYAGWRFVALDTSDRALRDDQMRWLQQVVTSDGRTIIFTHVPPAFLKKHFYSPPKPGMAADEFENLPAEAKSTVLHDFLTAYFDQNSDAFGRLLEERKVPRVYLGHIHAFGVARRGPTLFVLSGGGGSPLYPLPPGEPKRKMTHFLEVRVDAGGVIAETVHELDGDAYPMPLPPADLDAVAAGPAPSDVVK